MMIKARTFMLMVGGLLAVLTGCSEGKDESPMAVHKRIITIDTHCDTPMALLEGGLDVGKRNEAPGSLVDFPRMEEGGLDAIFFAAFTGQKPRTEENTQNAYEMANKMIEKTYEVCETYSEMAEVATTPEDVVRLEKEGKRAIYIGMENGFPLGQELGRVGEFYTKGVRYITLCHSSNNDVCDSSTDKNGPEHDGLSPFGKEVVKEMNRLGMLIDVSHISDKSFYDVVELSKVPVFASHSSVRAIAHHNRNMNDDMIKALAKNGGVIQICLLDSYIKDPDTTTIRYQKEQELRKTYMARYEMMTDQEKDEFRQERKLLNEKYPKQLPTVADCVDHIDHIKNLVGIDYVGIGSDFDGGGGLADCADVSQMPNITAEMLKRGYTEEEIAKVWGGNFLRVFAEVVKNSSSS
ncbi:dipeptidase [Draconibacterium sp. IB214405]|uniref:dipeptidase n=1 Tax=Draconibacterium sp. IB214405 TaxID=3097352 RepID=UPI002A14A312|nr:dipeptidase [Draconibacterium sp. IB214405]MDX8337606.1 dipeptidase [Draconibacterium sp. IB214405]